MTPKEKAKEIVKKYIEFKIDGRPRVFGIPLSKQFALIAVDEIVDALEKYDDRNDTYELQNMDGDFRYWDKVKQEIEKL